MCIRDRTKTGAARKFPEHFLGVSDRKKTTLSKNTVISLSLFGAELFKLVNPGLAEIYIFLFLFRLFVYFIIFVGFEGQFG